jgi:hypothetical protein
MVDLPILFSAPMVRALIDGRKTQTRRVLKSAFADDTHIEWFYTPAPGFYRRDRFGRFDHIPLELPFAPGDRLWVRETHGFNHYEYERGCAPKERPADLTDEYLSYRATEDDYEIRNELCYRPSIHMPRWASRLTLTVTDVRVERLQDISEADAKAEGVEMESADPPFYYVPGILPHSLTAVGIEEPGGHHARRSYAKLWDHINGAGAWEANPWVVAVSFSVAKRNIDAEGVL